MAAKSPSATRRPSRWSTRSIGEGGGHAEHGRAAQHPGQAAEQERRPAGAVGDVAFEAVEGLLARRGRAAPRPRARAGSPGSAAGRRGGGSAAGAAARRRARRNRRPSLGPVPSTDVASSQFPDFRHRQRFCMVRITGASPIFLQCVTIFSPVATIRVMRISVASDSLDGVASILMSAIEKRGHTVIPHGAVADERADWAWCCARAAEDVASGAADQAIVCCWTGTGRVDRGEQGAGHPGGAVRGRGDGGRGASLERRQRAGDQPPVDLRPAARGDPGRLVRGEPQPRREDRANIAYLSEMEN